MSARKPSTFADVLRTVLVMAAVLLGIAVVGRVFTVDPGPPPSTLDPAEVAPHAARDAGVPLYAPRSLPPGWRATAAEMRGDVWHIGVVTADEDYIGMEQAQASSADTLRRFAKGSRADGDVRVGGVLWSRRTEADGDTVFLRRAGSTTLLVIGSAPRQQLESYLSSLESTGS
ncbi:MAG TPA: DUF4245 domain-containing protein [Aeromicrobium sp.]|nr:DUF4245 domain-containing protein [Aeromicrobium sp.]